MLFRSDLRGYALEENILHEGLVEEGDYSFKDTIRLINKYHGWDNRIWVWLARELQELLV